MLKRAPRGLVLLVMAALQAVPAHPATFKLLYAFTGGSDGGGPWGPPLLYGGNLYGTTSYGGTPPPGGVGTVFEFLPNDGYPTEETYTYSPDSPMTALLPWQACLQIHMAISLGPPPRVVSAYAVRFSKYRVVTNSFCTTSAARDGEAPEGGLVIDSVGNLYGTTSNGGANDCGILFRFGLGGNLTQLYNFGNYKGDGVGPASSLLLKQGVLYGATTEGGQKGWGTAFAFDVKAKLETVSYSFTGGSDGGTPVGGLVGSVANNSR